MNSTPAMRAALASAVTAAALYYTKPPLFFKPDGAARLPSWTIANKDQREEAVLVPWWLAAVAVGVAVDLFI